MKRKHLSLPTAILLAVGALKVAAAGTEIINVSASPQVKFHTIGLAEARWTGRFWGERWEQDCRVTIPTLKQVMELPTNSATFHNLRVAAGEIPGKFYGNHWGDGDCYKWIEAAASIYALNHDPGLDRQLDEVIAIITKAQAPDGYITGGTAALHYGEAARRGQTWKFHSVHEAFGAPYQLPNRTAYNETCANIANAMWNWRMLLLTGDAKYADVMERVFYNSMLSGIGLGGSDYFYTNPLRRCGEDVPLLSNDARKRWMNTTPASPVACFCCPPSLARTIAQLHTYAYGVSEDTVWVHLYGAGRLDTRMPGGGAIQLSQTTDYPWDGKVSIRIEQAPEKALAVRLRIPGWVEQPVVKLNGLISSETLQPSGYLEIRRGWKVGDVVELQLPMPVVLMESHPLVEETRNQVAVMRGPLVYCLEDKDLPLRVAIGSVRIDRDAKWTARHEPDLLHGVTLLEAQAHVVSQTKDATALYRRVPDRQVDPMLLRLIPYYAWCNRGVSEMTVWLPTR
jgi:DUF1680 family protein